MSPYLDCCPNCPSLPAVPPVRVATAWRGGGVIADYLGSCGCMWVTGWARQDTDVDRSDHKEAA